MRCDEFDDALEELRRSGAIRRGMVQHAASCERCGPLLAAYAVEQAKAERERAVDAAIERGVARARRAITNDPRLDTVVSSSDDVFRWISELAKAGWERLVGSVRSLDFGLAPQFAPVMHGAELHVRPITCRISLSGEAGEAGWEPEAVLRVIPHRIELLLKPQEGVPESDRLMPRVALHRADGSIALPEVTQMSQPLPNGYHSIVVWESESERVDEVFERPLRGEIWFSKPLAAAPRRSS